MATEPEWREKYRDALGRLASEEARWTRMQNVMKLLVGRLCLAAQGQDGRLDYELRRIADSARKSIDIDTLDVLIAPLSAAVAALDSAEATNGSPVPAATAAAAEPRPDSTTGRAEEPERAIAAPGAISAPTAPAAPSNDTSASPSAAQDASSLTESAEAADEAASDSDNSFGATAVLDRLALLPELKPLVGELRSRRKDRLDIHELAGLLERVTRFTTEQRSQVQKEKLELENIVQQMAVRLEEISQHLTAEMAERNAGQDDCDQLNLRMSDEVTQLRLTAENASDITSLRHQLSARLDAISGHLNEFRSREETRVRTYKDRVQRMRTRIAVLERESRTLHESLREEQRMAMIDALTGIPNRAAYDDRIEQEYKRWKRFGHRSLQNHQRCVRTQGGRQGAAGHRPAPRRSREGHGFRRPLWRRRIRDAARGDRSQ
jgi:diguanylate cyclase